MELMKNLTTGKQLQGQPAPDGSCVIISHGGQLLDISAGDTVQTEGQLLAVIDAWATSTTFAQYSSALGLPLDHLAVIRRNGQTVGEGIRVNAGTVSADPQLQELLVSSTGLNSPLGKAAKLRGDLIEVLSRLDDQDQELAKAVQDHITQYDTAYRILLGDGSGTQVGDQVSTADGLATIERLDRTTWPGLTILICGPVENQPRLLQRLSDRVTA